MIKSERGCIECDGLMIELLADIGCVVQALYKRTPEMFRPILRKRMIETVKFAMDEVDGKTDDLGIDKETMDKFWDILNKDEKPKKKDDKSVLNDLDELRDRLWKSIMED